MEKKNSPSGLCDDHFGAEVVEFIPKFFRFEVTVDGPEIVGVARAHNLGLAL
jgi:hypothetical protein